MQHKAAHREERDPRPGSAYAARAALASRRAPITLPPVEPDRPSKPSGPSGHDETALAVRRPVSFRMVEATNDEGHQVWVVTDGAEYAVCNTKGLAERVRDALG